MIPECLIVADDFTGALDNAVQLAQKGYTVQVATDPSLPLDKVNAQVLAVTTESRHLSPEEAYRRVFHVVQTARRQGIASIYKKVDSALRGNIGIELQAVLDASGFQTVSFLPAYPAMNRVTIHGVQFCDGRPVAQSSFGCDPFTPVVESDIKKLIARTSVIEVVTRSEWEACSDQKKRVVIYDAETNEDIQRQFSQWPHTPFCVSGSAGAAAYVDTLLNAKPQNKTYMFKADKILIVNGSIHPNAMEQVAYIRSRAVTGFSMPPVEELEWGQDAATQLAEKLKKTLQGDAAVLLYSNSKVRQSGATTQQDRYLVSECFGEITSDVVGSAPSCGLIVAGGDTLFSIAKHLGVEVIEPYAEVEAGVVLSKAVLCDGRELPIISKAGSFGIDRTLWSAYQKLLEIATIS